MCQRQNEKRVKKCLIIVYYEICSHLFQSHTTQLDEFYFERFVLTHFCIGARRWWKLFEDDLKYLLKIIIKLNVDYKLMLNFIIIDFLILIPFTNSFLNHWKIYFFQFVFSSLTQWTLKKTKKLTTIIIIIVHKAVSSS